MSDSPANTAASRRLAINGSAPAFDEPLHVGRPNLGDRAALMQRIESLLDRNWLTNDGPFVREFEQRVAERLGVRHCVAMSNGTVALEIAIRANGLTGEVIVPSYTFIATAHALQWQGVEPVFADLDPVTHNIDPDHVASLITPRTTGIIGVHLWGQPCDIEGLARIADEHGLRLLFDASHAFTCVHNGRPIGGFGNAEVFSFHATKFANCFEGGAVCTDDDDLARRMRLMRNFGFNGYDNVAYIGTNGKMSEVCAAMGHTSLDAIAGFLAANRENHAAYSRRIDAIPGLRVHPVGDPEQRNMQYVVVEVDEAAAGLSRDEFIAVLFAENVRARRYFWPGCHRQEPYRGATESGGLRLPNTDAVAARVFTLPTGTSMDASKIETIADVLEAAVAQARSLREGVFTKPLSQSIVAHAFCHPLDQVPDAPA